MPVIFDTPVMLREGDGPPIKETIPINQPTGNIPEGRAYPRVEEVDGYSKLSQ